MPLRRSAAGQTEEFPQLHEMLSMRIKDAVRLSGISRDGLYTLLHAGEILSFTMGARRFIDAASLTAYVARRAHEPLTTRRSPKPRAEPQARPRTGPQTGPEAVRAPSRRQKSLPFEPPSRTG
jgi:hypothetical protein